MSGKSTIPIEQRFWSKVKVGDPSECWEWAASLNGRGYGQFGMPAPFNRPIPAHRVAWLLTHGSMPDPGVFVCHSCDNKLCVNPAHLWLGSLQDNHADMTSKGRGFIPEPLRRYDAGQHWTHRPEAEGVFVLRGAANLKAKLTEPDVVAIRLAAASGEMHTAIARRFGVGSTAIGKIVRRERWAHIA